MALGVGGAWAAPVLGEGLDVASVQIHGYGEFHYNNPRTGTMSSGAGNRADVPRFVLGWAYDFTPNLRVDGEIDFEHAAREPELEYAQIDYDLSPSITLRVGSLLMPVGPLNEFHEPPTFYSVERPYVQHSLIPTTWQEVGAGFVGLAANGVSYRAYVTAGLDASGFGARTGLRGGRSGGSESKADDLAGVARAEWSAARGWLLGASGYYGGADQRAPGLGNVAVTIVEADTRYRRGGFDLRGVYVRAGIDGADSVSALVGETVGEWLQGWYLEGAYNVLHGRAGGRALYVFARHEDLDTNHEVPEGWPKDRAADRSVLTAGLSFLPTEKVAFKADFERWVDGTDATLNRVNLGAAFMF